MLSVDFFILNGSTILKLVKNMFQFSYILVEVLNTLSYSFPAFCVYWKKSLSYKQAFRKLYNFQAERTEPPILHDSRFQYPASHPGLCGACLTSLPRRQCANTGKAFRRHQ